jgi:hypothetical protein
MFRALSTIGRGSLTSFWTLFWVLVCLHQLYYGWFLVRSSFVPYVMDGNETFSVWWHAHNLYTFSFWKSFGLTDESYGLTEASHPFFHTHQGNMPRLFGFLIYALGARTVEAQVLVTTLIIGNLTLFFCYASIAKIARPAIAFIFCLFLFSDYLLYAQWHVVTYRVWYGFLFFGTLFAILYAERPHTNWPYLLLGGLFFLLFYGELVFAGYVSALCGLFALWWHWGSPKKIAGVYLAQFIGGATALVLLFLQLKAALGLDVVVKDFGTTFLARNASAADASATSPVDFFHSHNIVFWENFRDGASLWTLHAFVRSIGTSVFQIWTPAFFVMVAAPFLGIVVAFVERSSAGSLGGLYRPEKIESPRVDRLAVSQPVFVSIVDTANNTVLLRQFELARLPGMSLNDPPLGFVWCASVLGLLSGLGLADAFVFQSGQLFGVAPTSSVAIFPIAFATMAIALSLVGLLIAHFGFIPLIAKAWKAASKYSVVIIPVISLLVIVEVLQPGRLPHPSIELISSSNLTAVAVGISLAGVLLGYSLRGHSLLAISRATLVCSLVAVVLAKNSLLYDQNYQDIWLSLVQDGKIRFLIRLTALITVGLGVAIALWGASSSFGRTQKAGVGRVLVFFFIGLFSYAIIYVLSPGYVFSGYVERLASFAIFFLSSIPTIAIFGIIFASRRCSAWLFRDDKGTSQVWSRGIVSSSAIFAVAVIFLFWAKVQIYYARMFPPDHVAFAKALASPPFRGASFGVGNYAAVVAYYTGNWAYMDMTFGTAMSDPKNPLDEHLKDRTALWFADWTFNGAYNLPTYYACMKPQNFDSALALRDPVRFGNRFSFCNNEPIVAGQSDFDDRTLASDQPVPRFWAVVKPGKFPSRVVSIDSLLARGVDKWTIDYKLEIIASPERRNSEGNVELITSPGATTCNVNLGDANSADAQTDGSGFELPADFAGLISVRTRTSQESKKLGWVEDRWIVGGSSGGSSVQLSHCPQKIIESSFAGGGSKLQSQGWSAPESWGAWSIGESSTLSPIEIRKSQLNSDFLFEADVRSFVPSPDHPQSVRMLAGGVVVADWLFTPSNYDRRNVRALIPRHLLAKDRMLHISFETPDAVSPYGHGPSGDTRKLGIGIRWLKIEAWTPSPSSRSYDEISFRPERDDGSYLAAGWTPSGEAGVTVQDTMASLLLPVPRGILAHPTIAIDASLVDQNGQKSVIDVFANNRVIGQITGAATAGTSSFDLPDDLGSSGTLLIVFKKAQSIGLSAANANLSEPLPLLLRNIRVDWIRQ